MSRRRLAADVLVGGMWAVAFVAVAALRTDAPLSTILVVAAVTWPLVSVLAHGASALGHRLFDPPPARGPE